MIRYTSKSPKRHFNVQMQWYSCEEDEGAAAAACPTSKRHRLFETVLSFLPDSLTLHVDARFLLLLLPFPSFWCFFILDEVYRGLFETILSFLPVRAWSWRFRLKDRFNGWSRHRSDYVRLIGLILKYCCDCGWGHEWWVGSNRESWMSRNGVFPNDCCESKIYLLGLAIACVVHWWMMALFVL